MGRHSHSDRHRSRSHKRCHNTGQLIAPSATNLLELLQKTPIQASNGTVDSVLKRTNIEVKDSDKFTADLFRKVAIPNTQIAESVIDTFIPVSRLVVHT